MIDLIAEIEQALQEDNFELFSLVVNGGFQPSNPNTPLISEQVPDPLLPPHKLQVLSLDCIALSSILSETGDSAQPEVSQGFCKANTANQGFTLAPASDSSPSQPGLGQISTNPLAATRLQSSLAAGFNPRHQTVSEQLSILDSEPTGRQAPPIHQITAGSLSKPMLPLDVNQTAFNLVPPGLDNTSSTAVQGMLKTHQIIKSQVLPPPTPAAKFGLFRWFIEKALKSKISISKLPHARKTSRDAASYGPQAEPLPKRSKSTNVKPIHV